MTDGSSSRPGSTSAIAAILAAETGPDRRFFVTGRQHVKARAADIMLHDVVRLIPLAVLVGTAVAWLVTGSLRARGLRSASAWWRRSGHSGCSPRSGKPLNLITIVLGPMLICMGAVYGVHVLARYDLLAAELATARAAEACLRDVVLPEMISGVTTMIGFAALLVAPQPAIQEFALFSIFGVTAMGLVSVDRLPALFATLPLPARAGRTRTARAPPARSSRAIDALLARMATLATTRPTPILVVWTSWSSRPRSASRAIVVDTDYLSFFDAQLGRAARLRARQRAPGRRGARSTSC